MCTAGLNAKPLSVPLASDTSPPDHPQAEPCSSCPSALTAESRTTTIYAFHTLSYISEGIIFVYCGLDALDPLKWQVGRLEGPPVQRSGHRHLPGCRPEQTLELCSAACVVAHDLTQRGARF